jgi:hypothetical protein
MEPLLFKLEVKEGRSCPCDMSLLSGLAEPESLTLTASQARATVIREKLVIAEIENIRRSTHVRDPPLNRSVTP